MTSLMNAVSLVRGNNNNYGEIGLQFRINYPVAMRALQLIDHEITAPRTRKGYNLVKRENRRHGFLYYVRYYHEGKMLPSKWNTHTNTEAEAERFALENKERIVADYLLKSCGKAYALYENFFCKGSEYLERRRGKPLCETTRASYHSIITKKFIPFLKEGGIARYGEVTVRALSDFQDRLLAGETFLQKKTGGLKEGKGKTPQSVNNDLKAVRRIFSYLEGKKLITANPCRSLKCLSVYEEDRNKRGCHDIERVQGVFNRVWGDKRSYLLSLLIYTTGMRNGEIKRLRMDDITMKEGVCCIDIKKSKTPNGARYVPLHENVYKKLQAYAGRKGKEGEIFAGITNVTFREANIELGKKLRMGEGELREQNITFYSGRHYWKTLMEREGLGEAAEELFMGHKVSGDMKKLYLHHDKQGKTLLARKAKQVLAILDKRLFKRR